MTEKELKHFKDHEYIVKARADLAETVDMYQKTGDYLIEYGEKMKTMGEQFKWYGKSLDKKIENVCTTTDAGIVNKLIEARVTPNVIPCMYIHRNIKSDVKVSESEPVNYLRGLLEIISERVREIRTIPKHFWC
jgi:hypothetical protein